MSSNWFRAGDSESESEHSTETEETDSEEEYQEKTATTNRSKWTRQADVTEKDEGRGRGNVLSQRDKRAAELRSALQQLDNAGKNRDFNAIHDSFEKLTKLVQSKYVVPPKGYLKAICVVESWVKETDKEDKKKAKAVTLVGQKVKKESKKYEEDVNVFKETWEEDDTQLVREEEDEDSDEEGEEPKTDFEEGEGQGDWKIDVIERKLAELLAARGKRSTDRKAQVQHLRELLRHTPFVEKQFEILFHIISALFDMTPSMATHIPVTIWRSAYDTLMKLLNMIYDTKNLVVQEAETHVVESPPKEEITPETVKATVPGNFLALSERLFDEYIRALQFTDPHGQDYVTRLQDDGLVTDALERVYHFYATRNMPKHAARLAVRLMEHLHWRRQDIHALLLARQRQSAVARSKKADDELDAKEEEQPKPKEEKKDSQIGRRQREYSITEDIAETMQKFLQVAMRNGDEVAKVRGLMYLVYNTALHGNYTQARDTLLMSKLNELVFTTTNTGFQILYNRCLAQLGFAAFQNGLFKEVHTCLNDLCASTRVRELLAQALPQRNFNERKPEQEKQERLRLVPFHQHINTDALEASHLVSSMLLEVPILAANPFDLKRRMQSKAFNKLFFTYQNQVFLGPPENTRDHVYAASQALLVGDWKKCHELILGLPAWGTMRDPEHVKSMLKHNIQEEGLRCYLLQHTQFYDTLSAPVLAEKFELPANRVHAICSRMMFKEELSGTWDQPAACIRVHRTHPTKMQHMAIRVADRVDKLVEYNERTNDSRAAGFGAGLGRGRGGRGQEGGGRGDGMWGRGGGRGGRGGGRGGEGGHQGDRGGYDRGGQDRQQGGGGFGGFGGGRGGGRGGGSGGYGGAFSSRGGGRGGHQSSTGGQPYQGGGRWGSQ